MLLKKLQRVLAVGVFASVVALSVSAQAGEGSKNQVFFRGGYSMLTHSRGGEVFTDAGGATTLNNGKSGFDVAGGVDLNIVTLFDGKLDLLGEIMVDYSKFSRKTVTQATSVLLGGAATSNISVSELNVGISPKARLDLGHVRPFIIPIGLSFLVNSPPSDDANYLDLGINTGAGIDFKIVDWLSLGVDVRFTHGFHFAAENVDYLSTGAYAGLNF